MKTRSADAQKSAAAAKKTPPATKKGAAKAQETPSSAEPVAETPKSGETKRASSTRGKQAKTSDSTPESKPQTPVEQTQGATDAAQATPQAKPSSGTKVVRRVVRKVVKRTPVSKAASRQAPKSGETEKATAEETEKEKMEEDAKNGNGESPDTTKNKPSVENVEGSGKGDKESDNVDQTPRNEEEMAEAVQLPLEKAEVVSEAPADTESSEAPEPSEAKESKELKGDETGDENDGQPENKGEPVNQSENEGEPENKSENEGEPENKSGNEEEPANKSGNEEEPANKSENKVEPEVESENRKKSEDKITVREEDANDEIKAEDASLEAAGDEKIEGLSDQEVHEEFGAEDFADDDVPENEEQTKESEEERAELNAAARERKIRKEREIFVGGLDRDAKEEDIRRVFQHAGEVVDIRIHKDPSTNKNKGYAFVQFATKEQASRALSEMKNPVIHGKRCGTAPSEDNDTLFLGNICNTWTKEAIKQKLRDYGLEGVGNITLVADPRHEGLSRGFAFVEFSSHAEAMLAYKRLQKPDALFGHPDRTAKVAFAEPLREPDPEVMAQVKSVFVDGLPPHWDEDRVREKFKDFGEIARIMLARNMSTAKRKDFGFVDFTSHEAAVACVEGVNNTGLSDGNSKIKVKARLSNPLPKTQAVKGGMVGGFRIGHSNSGTFSRSGRGFGRGGNAFNRENFHYDKGSQARGPGQGGRLGFPNQYEFDRTYPPFQGRQNFGQGGRWGYRGAHQGSLPARPYIGRPHQGSLPARPYIGRPHQASLPARPYIDRPRHSATDRGHVDYEPFRRQPYPFEEGYNRPIMGRHFNDPYMYDDASHGMKRPYYMMDHDPDRAAPSRHRPRLDHSDPAVSLRGTHYGDDIGAGGGMYSQNYYGPDYREGPYSSFYGRNPPYGRGYYY